VFKNKKFTNREQFIDTLSSPFEHLPNVLNILEQFTATKDESVISAKTHLEELCEKLGEINKNLNENKEKVLILKRKAEQELEKVFFLNHIDKLPVSLILSYIFFL
jgi:hypothetical protein